MCLRVILHIPRHECESESEEKNEIGNDPILECSQIFFLKNSPNNSSNSKQRWSYDDTIYYNGISWYGDIESYPEISFGEDRYKEKEISKKTGKWEESVGYESESSKKKHECCDLHAKGESHKDTRDKNDGISFPTRISFFPEWKESKKSAHTKEHKCWIELHILCLLEHCHRDHIVYGSEKNRKREEWFFSTFLENIGKSTDDGYDREDSSELIHIECLSGCIGEEKTCSGNELPEIESPTMEKFSRSCHDLREIHIDTEVIPTDGHRTKDIDQRDREDEGDEKYSKFYREKFEVQWVNEGTIQIMILEDERSVTYISVRCSDTRNGYNTSNDERNYKYWESISEKIGEYEQDATQKEKSYTCLDRPSDTHIRILPFKESDTIEDCISTSSRQQSKHKRIDEESDDVNKKNYTGWFRAIHEWTLYHIRETRVEATENQEMEEKESKNSKKSNFQYFLLTGKNTIRFVSSIDNSDNAEISEKSCSTLEMGNLTIEIGIIHENDRDRPYNESGTCENKLNHRRTVKKL